MEIALGHAEAALSAVIVGEFLAKLPEGETEAQLHEIGMRLLSGVFDIIKSVRAGEGEALSTRLSPASAASLLPYDVGRRHVASSAQSAPKASARPEDLEAAAFGDAVARHPWSSKWERRHAEYLKLYAEWDRLHEDHPTFNIALEAYWDAREELVEETLAGSEAQYAQKLELVREHYADDKMVETGIFDRLIEEARARGQAQ
ncbi:MAG: hypothetical protein DI568_17025 [Sphingomonas sp.]|nr:MAG: hypothetical protein DI568_17025 [Sphingomonas sp.]